VLKQHLLKERELVKAKVATNWQTEKEMCDSFVHIITKLQGGDSGSQAPIDMNGLFHSNWVSLVKITNQSIMDKRPIHLPIQITH
jgi:hypothetical protein